MPSEYSCLIALLLLAVVTMSPVLSLSTATSLATLQAIGTANPFIYGSAMVSHNTTTSTMFSIAQGVRDSSNGDLFTPDTPIRGNTAVGELCVATVVQLLINSASSATKAIASSLDSSINSLYLPGALALTNPNAKGVSITLRMLLTHTSTIVDSGIMTTSSNVGDVMKDLITFTESYFLQPTTPKQYANVWSSSTSPSPGSASAFQYAKANTVLLAYIVQQYITANPSTVVASGQQTIGAYMQEQIFAPLGMTNTFFVLPNGTLPVSSKGYAVFSNKAGLELSGSTGTLSRAVQSLFSGYPADFMLRTSASDIFKLMRGLFVDGSSALYSVGTQMVASSNLVNITDVLRPGVKQQGLGIVVLDPAVVCSAAASLINMPAGCSIQNATLAALVGPGSNTLVSGVCALNVDGQLTTCTAAVFANRPTRALSLSTTAYVAHAATFNGLFIDAAVTEGTSITPDTQSPTQIFGFFVFLGAFGAILAVLLLAYLAEYILHPVPLIGTVTNSAYPTLQDHVDRSTRIMRKQQSNGF